MSQFLRTFFKLNDGNAAVEFAVIAPLLAGVLLSGFAGWDAAQRRQDLGAALDLGTAYYLGGGTDDSDAKSRTMSGWDNAPGSANVTISRLCKCGSVTTTCNSLCVADRPPATHVVISASADYPDALVNKSITGTRTLRVR